MGKPVLQIFGIKNSSDTRKAERFFKERGLKYDFRDLKIKGLSKGELESLLKGREINDILDTEGKEYQKKGLRYMKTSLEDEILTDSLLLKMPIVRLGQKSAIGLRPDLWESFGELVKL